MQKIYGDVLANGSAWRSIRIKDIGNGEGDDSQRMNLVSQGSIPEVQIMARPLIGH